MGLKREGSILTEKEMLMDIKPLTTRGLIIYQSAGSWKILVLKKIDENGHVIYTFPGGHLQEGEDPKEGLAREIEEETGVHRNLITNSFDLSEIFRHYKIDKKEPERGNGIMSWFSATLTKEPRLRDSYFEHKKWIIPVWLTFTEFVQIRPDDVKPNFMKEYINSYIGNSHRGVKFLEEVYTC